MNVVLKCVCVVFKRKHKKRIRTCRKFMKHYIWFDLVRYTESTHYHLNLKMYKVTTVTLRKRFAIKWLLYQYYTCDVDVSKQNLHIAEYSTTTSSPISEIWNGGTVSPNRRVLNKESNGRWHSRNWLDECLYSSMKFAWSHTTFILSICIIMAFMYLHMLIELKVL